MLLMSHSDKTHNQHIFTVLTLEGVLFKTKNYSEFY